MQIYPPGWRARYSEEMSELMEQARLNRDRSSSAMVRDVLVSGTAERLRSIGLLESGRTPEDRRRAGVLRVLWAWVIFVLGGIGVAKVSEHWSNSVPASSQGVPNAAFEVLVVMAVIGSVAVVIGGLLPLRRLVDLLRSGGWTRIRTPIVRALVLTLLTVGVLVAVASWAHGLTYAERNGADTLYSAAVLGWALLVASCLFAWVIAAVRTAGELSMTERLLKAEALVSGVVAITMLAMVVSTAVWWMAVARSAPWFFAGTATGTAGTVVPLNLLVAGAFMSVGVTLGLSGTFQAVRAAAPRR